MISSRPSDQSRPSDTLRHREDPDQPVGHDVLSNRQKPASVDYCGH